MRSGRWSSLHVIESWPAATPAAATVAPDGRCIDQRVSVRPGWLPRDRRWQTIARPSAAVVVPQLLKRSSDQLRRWALWLAVRLKGRWQIPRRQRHWLRQQADRLPPADQPLRLREAPVQPFVDLLNRPAGGEAYCGGPLLLDPQRHWPLHHFRGDTAIDSPLAEWADWEQQPERVEARLFWCGPLAFHFGHQIADFGSRVLCSSLDPRGGELLWIPWRTPAQWPALKHWQQQLLTYLNPGHKRLRLATAPLMARELIVWPQQARMRAAPTAVHLEALSWCERTIPKGFRSDVVYVSRNRFAPCTSSET